MGISNHYSSQTASTYQGPVPQGGVLNLFVQQISDTSPSYDNQGNMRYKAVFKGPYIRGKDFNDMVGRPLQSCLASMSDTFDQNFTFPVPPGDGDYVWVITSTRIEQPEAGDHCLLVCDCQAEEVSQITPGTGGWIGDPDADTWQVRWEAFTCSPYYFCKNLEHEDRKCPDPGVLSGTILSGHANREHVDMFLNNKDRGVLNGHRWYRADDGNAYYLNYAEELVSNKKIQDDNALRHRPVLVHTTRETKHYPDISGYINDHVQFRDMVGLSVDYIVPFNAPELSSCPYTFPDHYIWVKQGDDVVQTNQRNPPRRSFQRVETYWGVMSADQNYYGHVKWDHTTQGLSAARWYPKMV